MLPITSFVQNSDKSWTVTWAATGAAFYRVVLWGTELAQTTLLGYTYTPGNYPNFPPPLEILPAGYQAQTELYQCNLVVQWYGNPAADHYLVQLLVAGNWHTVNTTQEVGSWIYSYGTGVLLDGTTYEWRVVAVDSYGNESPEEDYQINVVTNPVPPDGTLTASYNTGVITIQ